MPCRRVWIHALSRFIDLKLRRWRTVAATMPGTPAIDSRKRILYTIHIYLALVLSHNAQGRARRGEKGKRKGEKGKRLTANHCPSVMTYPPFCNSSNVIWLPAGISLCL